MKSRQKGKVMYTFYEKPMSSQFSVIESSAINDNTKRATMAQELVRRMLNVSELLNQQERNAVIEKFVEKLEKSGYSKKQRREIVLAGLQGYESKKRKAEMSRSELHRDGEATAGGRMTKKLLSKTSWYKQKTDKESKEKPALKRMREAKTRSKRSENNEKPPSAVLFVPRTPGGELAIRFREDCEGEDCMVCKWGEDDKGDCRHRSIVYKTECRDWMQSPRLKPRPAI